MTIIQQAAYLDSLPNDAKNEWLIGGEVTTEVTYQMNEATQKLEPKHRLFIRGIAFQGKDGEHFFDTADEARASAARLKAYWLQELEGPIYAYYGMKVTSKHSNGTEQVFRNVTEIHYRYPSDEGKKVAFESDIHGTGCTYHLHWKNSPLAVVEFEVTPETVLANEF